ncbi:MAG: hypothetical protein ACYSTY_09730 [Planctomycetota bacterium]
MAPAGSEPPLRRACRALAFSLFLLAPTAAGQDFSSHWHDGRAELDGYRWEVTRYSQQRTGQAVMIFVTEPFSDDKRVKVDDPSRNPLDTFDALKLNLVRDFQTGVYDYNTMTSVFVHSNDFAPAKISFTSAEWCGHVYEELLFDRRRVRERLFSYFEDESSTQTLARESGGIAEDNLFILLRGLRGAFLEPGEKKTVPFLPSAFQRRLRHRPLEWSSVEIERLETPETIEVPAGSFETMVYVVGTTDGREGRFFIEMEYPHRIVRWSWQADRPTLVAPEASEWGALTGTIRVKYWNLHDNGDESYLEQLGLTPDAQQE